MTKTMTVTMTKTKDAPIRIHRGSEAGGEVRKQAPKTNLPYTYRQIS
jgi:hypothetical protein